MGKVLRPEHIGFFAARMNEHNLIINWVPIQNEHDYLFRIRRKLRGVESDVTVHLTDAYLYSLGEFLARPDELGAGSYVVIGMPHASAAPDVIESARHERIGIGHIGEFMGALNYKNIWEYVSPEERRRRQQRLPR